MIVGAIPESRSEKASRRSTTAVRRRNEAVAEDDYPRWLEQSGSPSTEGGWGKEQHKKLSDNSPQADWNERKLLRRRRHGEASVVLPLAAKRSLAKTIQLCFQSEASKASGTRRRDPLWSRSRSEAKRRCRGLRRMKRSLAETEHKVFGRSERSPV